MNVLITSASRKVQLVKAFQQALAENGGGQVFAVDISPAAAALHMADRAFLVPRTSDPHFLSKLLDLCKAHAITLVVPTRDEELPLFAEAKPQFAAVGATVMVADPQVVSICQDKARFANFCLAHGFDVPRMFSSAANVTAADFPVFVRARVGKGSRFVAKAENRAELDYWVERWGNVIIQELVDASEYTIDLLADWESQVISVVPRRRVLTVGGESFISTTRKDPVLMDAGKRLAEALGLVGHNTVQCFERQGSVKFIEVNPRFGGAAALSFAAGAPSPKYLVQLCQAEKIAPRIGQFEDNFTMLRYTQDVYATAEELKSIAHED